MMTIVSRVQVEDGREPAWDEAFRKRAAAVREQPGFVSLITQQRKDSAASIQVPSR